MGAARSLCLFGAAGDTGNLGVSALLHATLEGIARNAPETGVTVFDNGLGRRPGRVDVETPEGPRSLDYDRLGARLSRRFHRPESFWNLRLSARLGGLANPGARAILAADAVWDLSGGDSFSDIYGERRLQMVLAPKEIALERGVPLVLLPQTYGPFRSGAARERAAAIVRRAGLVWARDEKSFDALRDLLGEAFDPEVHRLGVDVAFGLAPRAPEPAMPAPVAEWLTGSRDRPLVGINVSGLIANDPDAAAKYGLRCDYRRVVARLVERFLRETEARVLLVPHVLVDSASVESDASAGRALHESLSADDRRRVFPLPESYDQSGAKWIISKLDWFCGTRMHSTIAALSSGVPTAGMAYSPKMEGVFGCCGQERNIADLRSETDEAAVERVWEAWEGREESRKTLAARLPEVRAVADEQMRASLGLVPSSSVASSAG